MFDFFKTTNKISILFLFVFLLLLRVPFFVNLPIILPELHWNIIGKYLSDGNVLYKDLWDYTPPASAWVYSLLYFEGNRWLLLAISTILIFIQSLLFNAFLMDLKMYKKNSFIPAFCYIVCMHGCFDFIFLSPLIMGNTCILLGIFYLFRKHEEKKYSENTTLILTSFLFALSVLFYFPFVVLYIYITLFEISSIRKKFLFFLSGLQVFLLVFGYYYIEGGGEGFLRFFVGNFLIEETTSFFFAQDIFFLFIGFFSIFFLALLLFMYHRISRFYTNRQNVVFVFFFISVFLYLLSFSLTGTFMPLQCVIFVPFLSFIVSYMFFIFKEKWKENMFIISFLLLIPTLGYFNKEELIFFSHLVKKDSYKVQQNPNTLILQGKRIWVIGDDINYYSHSFLSMPYIHWRLSKDHLEKLEEKKNIIYLYTAFKKSPPDIIIDTKQILPIIFDKIPSISFLYQWDTVSGYYILKDPHRKD